MLFSIFPNVLVYKGLEHKTYKKWLEEQPV